MVEANSIRRGVVPSNDNEVPVRFIAYPIGGHSPEDPAHQMDMDRRWMEWFATYLK